MDVVLMGTLGAALIAAIAAIITAIVAYLTAQNTARRTAVLETTKLSVGIQQKNLEQLVAVRLVAYPALYQLLSAFRKRTELRPRAISAPVLSGFLAEVSDWDSAKAILLGPRAANVCATFRQVLNGLSETIAEGKRDATDDEINNLITHLTGLELALRSDLGIYGIEILETGNIMSDLPPNWG